MTITTPVLLLSNGAQVSASTFGFGNGGNLIGMVQRSREDLVRLLGTNKLSQLDPRLLPTSDITAISQQNPSLSGVVTVNTPDVDPNSGLVNLPVEPVDTEVAQGCTAGGSLAKSEFVITGRGGLPPNPGDALSTDSVMVDLVTLNPEVAQPFTPAASTSPTSPAPPPIVEAQGWVINDKGEVVLTASAPNATPHIPRLTPATCHAPETSP